MQLPEQTKERTSKVYSFILDGLNRKFPELGFNQLLLPDYDIRINSETLSNHILDLCVASVFSYGTLEKIFVFRYRCDLEFDFYGAKHTVSVDYRKPEQYFTEEFLSIFRGSHEHKYQELYWEEGGGGMESGTPHHYTLCKVCLKKKPNWIVSAAGRLIERLNLHFEGSV